MDISANLVIVKLILGVGSNKLTALGIFHGEQFLFSNSIIDTLRYFALSSDECLN